MKHTKEGKEQNKIRRDNAKSSAEALNNLVKDIYEIVGRELTREELFRLAGLLSLLDNYTERAERAFDSYEDHCIKWNYEPVEIEFLV